MSDAWGHEGRGEFRISHISTVLLLECIRTAIANMIIPLPDVLLERIRTVFPNMIIPLTDIYIDVLPRHSLVILPLNVGVSEVVFRVPNGGWVTCDS